MDPKSASLWKLLQFLSAVFLSVSEEAPFLQGPINITAEPGQNVTLPCRGSRGTIIVVEWSRTDLGSEYVLRYRDQQLDPENQNPSFRNRVDLLDPQMKAGDVSVVLKNLTTDDRGTYECRVVQRGTRRRKRGSLKTRPVSSVVLDVVPSGSEDESREDGSVGLLVGLPVSIIAAAAAVAVGLIIYKRPGCLQQLYEHPAHQTAVELH
ncbi:PREDICTED: nectin-4-like [Cyprinodon variegatus]|uniref:nectin-4-like n=1 Tax=Cyprinodon variegatus TaxID=28743 RepID=UPI000742C2A3|nr:PREDICTED: nectin-4-like [Cyprinodon variegatus]